jgi:hypothetical protein
MVEELEISAIKLAQSERKLARNGKNRWHMRLKPLTPMRLTVQSFERKFNPEDLKSYKNERLLGTLIQQIDTMNASHAFLKLRCQPTKRNAERSGSGRNRYFQ